MPNNKKGNPGNFANDREKASRAGHKGGEEVSKDRGHMSEIGRMGGQS